MLYPRRLALFLALAALTSHQVDAKPNRTPAPAPHAVLGKNLAQLQLTPPALAKLQQEDQRRAATPGAPVRYGKVLPLGTLHAHDGAGIWRELPDGQWHWQLDVSAKGAASLEFSFSQLYLPHGATLTIHSADGKNWLDPLTDANNPVDGHLHTALLQTDRAVLELTVPADKREFVRLTLDKAVWGYRNPWQAARAKSGTCNVDTACPEGNAWREQIASVAGYAFSATGDRLMCTGSLMNTGNATLDVQKPRFSTANHCVANQQEASSMVFYWGYESPSCRIPGSIENGIELPVRPNTLAVQLGGATLIATNRDTDFTVVELNTAISSAAQVYYSGWDRSGTTPPGSVGIHHPSGHEKRITIDQDPISTMRNCIVSSSTSNNTHWRAGPYETGTTEGGSSGSGLWNPANGLLIGVLSGGNAECGNPGGYDCYGRLSAAWEASSPTGTTVRTALDRSGSNPQTLPGKNACDAPVVTVSSPAFTQTPTAGTPITLTASATGGAGNYTFSWDLDDDGVIEREGKNSLTVTYPSRRSINVRVRAKDSSGCTGSTSRALDVAAPVIEVTQVGTPQQVCGNGNGALDPGERFTLPVTFKNTGNAVLESGAFALFAPLSQLSGTGTANQAGYEEALGSQCQYNFIDIAAGSNTVTPLMTYVANGNSYGPRDDARSTEIPLGGNGFTLYGTTYRKAVMSTNGYVSFDPDESGGNWEVTCDGSLNHGAKGPQLRPYHDDLIVREDTGAGLRYRYFDTCPHPAASGVAQGCHVFQWNGMGYYIDDATIDGNFSFQAVAYARTGEVSYQYPSAPPDEGDWANIGLVGANGNDPLNLVCESVNQPVRAKTAYCIHSPAALEMATPALRLPQATLSLPALAAGASTTVSLPVAIRSDAACSAPLRVGYLATAGKKNHSTRASQHGIGNVAASCQAVSTCPVPETTISMRNGNYYNPERSGNGFNSYSFGGVWYTASTDHTPTWYLSNGTYQDNLLSAPLLQVRNQGSVTQLDTVNQRAGQLHLARTGTNRLMMAWRFNNGRSGAELLQPVTEGLPHAAPNQTQHWYAPSQSGWGMDVESVVLDQRRFEAPLVYFYDASGFPRWLIGEGFTDSNGRTPMRSYRPHCPGCPHVADWDTTAKNAGTLHLRWTPSPMISTDLTLPAPLQGEWKRRDVPLISIGALELGAPIPPSSKEPDHE